MPKTKIIATLGPATDSGGTLRKMFRNGLHEVRLNFSHGKVEDHKRRIRMVRDLNKKMRRAVKIMQDLEGPRIRVGKLKSDLNLKKGAEFYLTQDRVTSSSKTVPFDYKGSLKPIKTGFLIYVDDGKIILEVKKAGKKSLKVRSLVSGLLKTRKGINIPEAKLDFEALDSKDRADLKVGMSEKVDVIAQSFVRTAADVRHLKKEVHSARPSCLVCAKIESRQALLDIDNIINEADMVMIARGDLGVCIPIYKVPVVQKEIIKKCRLKNKPVIVATQMLESMIEEPIPTRAEVSDVANAILDGATHMLLSAETSIGKHPHKVVEMMDKIAKNTEAYQSKLRSFFSV
ncbi:MAG: pyruvate kinase [Candidatus Omnitrophica bacterium]|nr:pyruvate kinase [Candidatus Omnitrophota bacterium]